MREQSRGGGGGGLATHETGVKKEEMIDTHEWLGCFYMHIFYVRVIDMVIK